MPSPGRTAVIALVLIVVVAAAACEPTPIVQPLPSPPGAAEPAVNPDGSVQRVPRSARVALGVVYAYDAMTHCGFTPTTFDFDGSFWEPAPSAPAAQGANAPAGIDDPEDRGTITLVGPDEAVYTSSGGVVVPLLRLDGPQRDAGCY